MPQGKGIDCQMYYVINMILAVIGVDQLTNLIICLSSQLCMKLCKNE